MGRVIVGRVNGNLLTGPILDGPSQLIVIVKSFATYLSNLKIEQSMFDSINEQRNSINKY